MPNEAQLQLMEKARRDRDGAEQEATMTSALMKQTRQQLDQAVRVGDAPAIAAAESRLNNLSQRHTAALTRFRNAAEQLHQLRVQSAPAPHAAVPDLGSSDMPLILFPVRLETRFKDLQGIPKLLIRVYPDDIHVDAHERELTEKERARATEYWEEVWRAGTSESGLEVERAAWNRLCNEFGVERAAWMVRLLEPDNVYDRPEEAIPPNVTLTPAPVFNKVALRESTWTRAPQTRVLPDRWIAICYGGMEERKVVVGETIPDILNVGPQPDMADEQPADAKPEDLLSMLDEDMKWLVDFEAAKKVGMALEVRLSPVMSEGLQKLLVIGVKDSMKPEASGEVLAKLLDAHHYTHGIALVPPGTPTNNTSDERSGHQTRDPGHERSFVTERRRVLENPQQDGRVLATYLGLDAGVFNAVFASITGADQNHLNAARTMNTALWSATIGYFLDKRLTLLTPDQLVLVRDYFVEHVRSLGPLPTLRVGKQPYGLLPVVSLDQWQPPPAGGDMRGPLALKAAREVFRRALLNNHVPTLRDNDSIDWNLMRVLQMSPVSVAFNTRNVVGPVLTDNFWSFVGADLDTKWWEAQKALTQSIPGLPLLNPQSTSVFGMHLDEVKPPLVLPEGSTTLEPNYIAILAKASHQQLRDNVAFPSNPPPLLYSLLRHALLREYGDTALRILISQNLVTDRLRIEPELIDIIPGSPTWTVWRQLEIKIPAITGDKTLGQFLDDPQNGNHPQVRVLTELRAAVTELAQQPIGELERLIPETLDLASHRLDAWITSLATQRLKSMRVDHPTGVMLGGYGWLEDLKPAVAGRGSDGYMHAPSLTHATAAAMLASGYSSHKTGPGGTSLFAMNLSSERIRLARSLIEGVRQGQPLAALVGYRIERALYDNQQLASFVATFRGLAPLTGGPEPPTGPVDAVAANNVVHGLRILRLWKSNHSRFQELRAQNPTLFLLIDDIFRKAEDAVDAVSDLLVADGVYQTASGNFQRAGLTVEAIARGQAVPEPEIIKTPRTGTVLTHRLVAIFDPSEATSGNWPDDTPRATAEPSLNAWVGSLLGDPENVLIRGEHIDPATGNVFAAPDAQREIHLSDLGLSPLDVIALAAGKAGERGDLERWIEQHLRGTRPSAIPPHATIRLNRERNPQWSNATVSLDEFLVGVRAAARFLGGVRALEANSLTLPKETGTNTANSENLRSRADALVGAFGDARLDELLAAPDTTVEDLTEALLNLAKFNLPGAIPEVPADGSDPLTALKTLALTHSRVAEERLRKVVESETGFPRDTASIDAQVKHDTERIQTILGAGFAVIPQFRPANPPELALSFKSSSTLMAGNPLEAETWLLRLSRVRDRVSRFYDLRQCGELLVNNRLPLIVGQLPFQENDRWIGLPFENNNVPRGRLSLVAVGTLPPNFDRPLSGLVIDEWTEIVPADRETTGISFHYDQPGARPPHCILLAVPPRIGTPWSLPALESVLLETLELAKLRLVDQRGLQELSSYLPALYFAINAAGDTVSTDLRTGFLLGDPN